MQHMTGHYGEHPIETAGNQIRDAKGMKAHVNIDDVRLQDTANSKGTIGALDATITWTADGMSSRPCRMRFRSSAASSPA